MRSAECGIVILPRMNRIPTDDIIKHPVGSGRDPTSNARRANIANEVSKYRERQRANIVSEANYTNALSCPESPINKQEERTCWGTLRIKSKDS